SRTTHPTKSALPKSNTLEPLLMHFCQPTITNERSFCKAAGLTFQETNMDASKTHIDCRAIHKETKQKFSLMAPKTSSWSASSNQYPLDLCFPSVPSQTTWKLAQWASFL